MSPSSRATSVGSAVPICLSSSTLAPLVRVAGSSPAAPSSAIATGRGFSVGSATSRERSISWAACRCFFAAFLPFFVFASGHSSGSSIFPAEMGSSTGTFSAAIGAGLDSSGSRASKATADFLPFFPFLAFLPISGAMKLSAAGSKAWGSSTTSLSTLTGIERDFSASAGSNGSKTAGDFFPFFLSFLLFLPALGATKSSSAAGAAEASPNCSSMAGGSTVLGSSGSNGSMTAGDFLPVFLSFLLFLPVVSVKKSSPVACGSSEGVGRSVFLTDAY